MELEQSSSDGSLDVAEAARARIAATTRTNLSPIKRGPIVWFPMPGRCGGVGRPQGRLDKRDEILILERLQRLPNRVRQWQAEQRADIVRDGVRLPVQAALRKLESRVEMQDDKLHETGFLGSDWIHGEVGRRIEYAL